MVKHHAFVSDDGHAWRNVVVDSVHLGVPCVAAGCYPDYYSGHSSVTADYAGGLYFVYDGATRDGGRQRIFFTASFDGGDTWSPPRSISTPHEQAGFPMIAGTGSGDVRVWFMQTRDGDHNAGTSGIGDPPTPGRPGTRSAGACPVSGVRTP